MISICSKKHEQLKFSLQKATVSITGRLKSVLWSPRWGLRNSEVTRTHNQRRQWHPTPVLLPGKSHGWRSLVGCSPWGRWGSDTTEQLHFHFSLSCLGGGNGNPLQCSCLENPRDRGAWWAAVSGVAQSQTGLKRLSSSSSRTHNSCLGQRELVYKEWSQSEKVQSGGDTASRGLG